MIAFLSVMCVWFAYCLIVFAITGTAIATKKDAWDAIQYFSVGTVLALLVATCAGFVQFLMEKS